MRGSGWEYSRGITSDATGTPAEVGLGDCPSAKGQPAVAAAELDGLASLGEICECPRGDPPPGLRVCPPQLVVKPDKVRVARNWSNIVYWLDQS